MKLNLRSKLFVSALALTVVSTAQAIYNPSWERPIKSGALVSDGGGFPYPRAMSITMNKRDGEAFATSFDLLEDTGVRCFIPPCNTVQTTRFYVVGVSEDKSNNMHYEAVTRNADSRRIDVVDFEHHFLRPEKRWTVRVVDSFQDADYEGKYEYLTTIMSVRSQLEPDLN